MLPVFRLGAIAAAPRPVGAPPPPPASPLSMQFGSTTYTPQAGGSVVLQFGSTTYTPPLGG